MIDTTKLKKGEIKLPIFQRDEAWEKSKIISLLRTIIEELPLWITLGLRASSKKQFDSKYISGAEPESDNGFEYYLLDWQQRLTAFRKLMQEDWYSKGGEMEQKCIIYLLKNIVKIKIG